MNEREKQAVTILRDALDTSPDERECFISERCGLDTALRGRVDSLLRGTADADQGDESATDPATAAEQADILIGTRLGAFRIVERIGRGGMGVVYRGEREGGDFEQVVAIKLIRRGFDFDDVHARFLRERRILARLAHPNLARFIDGGVAADGRPWFALEFVRGETVTRWCDARRLDLRARVSLFLHVCAAVQYAHTQLVVHRDLKPAHVLVDDSGAVRLLDFGVAGLLAGDAEDSAKPSTIGQRHALTPEYAAPEQFAGEGAGVAVDVYALGVTLYELIAGVLPYAIDRGDLAAAAHAVRELPPQALAQGIFRAGTTPIVAADAATQRLALRGTSARAYRALVRGDLSRIVDKALAKEPERRYATVQAFADDLACWLAGTPVRVVGNGLRYRTAKFVRRNRVAVALTSLLVLSVIGAAIGMAWQLRQTGIEFDAAMQMKDQLVEIMQQSDYARLGGDAPAARDLLARSVERLDRLEPGSPLRRELAAEVVLMLSPLGDDALTLRVTERELGPDPTRGARSVSARLRQVVAWSTGMVDRSDDVWPVLRDTIDHSAGAPPLLLAEALTQLAEVELATGRVAHAVTAAERALELLRTRVPDSDTRVVYARFALAAALVGIRDVKGGRAQSERVLAALPVVDSRLRAFALTKAAMRRAVLGDFQAAETAYAEGEAMIVRLAYSVPRRFDHAMRAVNAFDLGQLDHARALIEPIRRANDDSPASYAWEPWSTNWLCGEIELAEQHFAQAAAHFGEAAAQAQNQGKSFGDFALYNRALHWIALAESGDPNAAHGALEAALSEPASTPSYASAMLHAARGVLLDRAGRYADAVLAFDASLAEQAKAQQRPIGLREQLMERRDAVRIRYWRAQALHDAGWSALAQRALGEAQQLGARTLGTTHPFMRQLQRLDVGPGSAPVIAN